MKKFLCLFLFFVGRVSVAFTPTLDFILGETAKHCLSGNVQMTGTMSEKEDVFFLNLFLNKNGLLIQNKTPAKTANTKLLPMSEKVNLYVVGELVTCEAKDAKKIKAYLVANKIDVSKINHGLYGSDPVFIIGADAADRESPQIWINKETFLPCKEKNANYEVIFLHWTPLRSLSDKKWPSTMLTIHNDKKEVKLDMAEAYPKPKRK